MILILDVKTNSGVIRYREAVAEFNAYRYMVTIYIH